MADLMSILSSNYTTVGGMTPSSSKYVAVDKDLYQGTWSGTYADRSAFSIQVTNVDGFRAKVKYQSGATTKYQDVLIRDNAFRIGDSKFVLVGNGKAKVATVKTDPATGASSLETAYATQVS